MRVSKSCTVPLAAAVLAAFSPAHAQEDEEYAQLTRPESAVRLGVGSVDADNRRFGQYTGMTESGAYGLLDVDIVRRNDATGTWLRFSGRNLGLDHRGARFEHERQGNWGYFIDFSQTPRIEPYVPHTNIGGIGTPNLVDPATGAVGITTPGAPVELGTRRDALGVGVNKYFGGPWSTRVTFRQEEKDGTRLFARGTTGAPTGAPFFGAFGFAPEPISSTTRQLEALVNYTGQQLQLSGGYYGTMYDNDHKGLFITGGVTALSGGAAPFTPIALPPDNQSHQLHVNGGYQFTPTTRATFRVARGRATQRDDFLTPAELAPGTVLPTVPSHLGARVNTTQAQLGLTARPMPRLSLRANLRFEDRDDRTPRFQISDPGATHDGFNEPRSVRTGAGMLEASYLLPAAVRLTGGLDYEEKRRNAWPLRPVSHRDKTEETTYRIGLRRAVAETVTGALTYLRSERDGSPFVPTGATLGNRVAPIHLADRTRDMVRASAEWQATDALSLQLLAEHARDDYEPIHALGIGPREGRAQNLSVDGALAVSEAWQVTAWASRNDNRYEQAQHAGAGTAGLVWEALLKNTGDSFGLGLRGRPTGVLNVGADFTYSRLKDAFDQRRLNAVSPATVVAPLPDIQTTLTRLQLFARYALQKHSGVRLDYVHDRFKTDDWQWTNFQYTDGTILVQPPLQRVNFVGLSYYYYFR